MKKIWYVICFLLVSCGGAQIFASVPHLNLFNPYDRVVLPPERNGVCWQLWAGFEGLVGQRSFQAAEDQFGNSHCFRKRCDVLQLYQDEQDFLAALKGDDFATQAAQLAQQFNIDDDDGTEGLFIPRGKFEIHNFWLSARRYLSHGFSVSVHLPIISMKLKDVTWEPSPHNTNTSFDSQITNDFIAAIERVGDLTGIIWWAHNFPQGRPLLQNVYLGARAGLVLPTGEKTDEDVMLGLALGHDAGTGLVFGGTMELSFCNYYLFGIAAEFLSLFGSTRCRRIKTDLAQTDLIFLSKVNTFADPGFIQHFTLYGKADYFVRGLSLGVWYQFTKQQETTLYLGTYHFNAAIANTAEELQPWTNHSVIFTASFDFFDRRCGSSWWPWLEVFYKHGFNGSRTVAADTIGAVFSVDF